MTTPVPFRMRRRLVLAKVETTYGTDSAPVVGTNAILCRSVTVTPMAGEYPSRDLLRPYYGNSPVLPAEKHVEMQLEIELAGSGVAGTAPAWSPLIRACGFAVTDVGGPPATSVAYTPVSTGETSITCWVHRDGILHKFTGARGTMTMSLSKNQIPTMTFSFLGLMGAGAITDVTMPTSGVSYAAWQTPVVAATDNTTQVQVLNSESDPVVLPWNQFDFDLGAEVIRAPLIGNSNIMITDRRPSGTLIVQEPPLATLNLYSKVTAAALDVFKLTHGTVAGNIIDLEAPKVACGQLTEQDVQGLQMLSLPLTFVPNAGNDEITITVR
jgi:hypothetical protein